MSRFTLAAAAGSLTAGALVVLAAALPADAAPGTSAAGSSTAPSPAHSARACGRAKVGYAACFAEVNTDSGNRPMATTRPDGFGPADVRSAYHLTTSGAGKTVAIIDAFDDPTAEADLAVYRRTYGLPPCTTANGCFRKVDQTGGTNYPRANAGWATEISLDLDMVSAACPGCHILLVEAKNASFGNLAIAVNYAASRHVQAISNSYGGSDTRPRPAYDHPGIAITASSGDSGYGVSSPATFESVISVGGTSLFKARNARGWREKAWSGSGSGCSTVNDKPAWQTASTQCSGKAVADVSAVADPATGVAVYDSTSFQGNSGWQVFGGTSAGAPIIASAYAMGGHLRGYPAAYTWAHPAGLNDVTQGSNALLCLVPVWCRARPGWDGPTGLGTPNGVGSF